MPKAAEITKELRRLLGRDDCSEMANLDSQYTGISNVFIFASPRLGSHGPRVKVAKSPTQYDDGFVVSISKSPQVLVGKVFVDSRTLDKVKDWVSINYDVLMDFWNGRIGSTSGLTPKLKKV